MVRFLAPALLVAPAAGDAFLSESAFTNMPDGDRRLTKQEACNDLVKAFVEDSKTSCSDLDKDAAMRACMDAAHASIDCNKEKCSWYDFNWNEVGSYEAAVKGVSSAGYYTCTGSEGCFVETATGIAVKQRRFANPGGKADLCAAVAKDLVAKNPGLQKHGYSVNSMQKDCENARASNPSLSCETSWCVIDTQEQQCLTALSVNDALEIKLRKGCECARTCQRGKNLKDCVAELTPDVKEWHRIEVVVPDDAQEDGSRNEKVRDLSEAVTCLKDIQNKEKQTGKSAGCSINFQPAFFTR